jgi:3-hydroxyisobutyrate dehydrogenase-like beta-hydroxyacid dehydrogenase
MTEQGSTTMKVGFIGLGRMGTGMARRLLEAGHDLAVYNRSPEKAEAIAAAGARIALSIADAARHGDVVITMLTNDAALEAVAGEGGLVGALPRGAIHLAMGTYGVAAVARLRDRHAAAGQILVAAPVLGRPDMAAAGQLNIVAGGPAEAVARCRPLLAVLGRRTFEAGSDPASASAIKVANNFVLGCAIEVMSEAFALVGRYGVAPGVFYDVLTDGLFSAPAYKVYGRIIWERAWDRVGVTATIGLKDANLALAAGEAVGVPLPSANVWRDRLISAIAHGDGERDWAVMALEQERASGLA